MGKSIAHVKFVMARRKRTRRADSMSSQRRSNKDDKMKNWEAQLDRINRMATTIKWLLVFVIMLIGMFVVLATRRLF